MPRLFIAIELPDGFKNKLGHLRVSIPGARWVPQEQLHLTLAFLGEIDDRLIPYLSESLDKIHSPGFMLRYSGTGCFPDLKRPRVLWAGFEPQPLLGRLVDKIRGVIATHGIPVESRSFVPHITLARIKTPVVRGADEFLKLMPKTAFPLVEVHEFTLFESRLTSAGAIHSVVKTFSFTN